MDQTEQPNILLARVTFCCTPYEAATNWARPDSSRNAHTRRIPPPPNKVVTNWAAGSLEWNRQLACSSVLASE